MSIIESMIIGTKASQYRVHTCCHYPFRDILCIFVFKAGSTHGYSAWGNASSHHWTLNLRPLLVGQFGNYCVTIVHSFWCSLLIIVLVSFLASRTTRSAGKFIRWESNHHCQAARRCITFGWGEKKSGQHFAHHSGQFTENRSWNDQGNN